MITLMISLYLRHGSFRKNCEHFSQGNTLTAAFAIDIYLRSVPGDIKEL